MKKSKGSWMGWNSFLNDVNTANPCDYLKSMVAELGRSKYLREKPEFIKQCKKDLLITIPKLERWSLGKPLATSLVKKINDRIFSGEEVVEAWGGPAVGYTIKFKVQPTYEWVGKEEIK